MAVNQHTSQLNNCKVQVRLQAILAQMIQVQFMHMRKKVSHHQLSAKMRAPIQLK